MDKKIIHKIIEAANLAPSGGNSQPWKFIANENSIVVIHLPEKDHPILNFRNRGTYVAHGAVMENIEIASRFFGYEPEFELFPSEDVSMKVTFKPSSELGNKELYEAIEHRHTNRKPFEQTALTESKEFLFEEAHRYSECELLIAEGDKIQKAAEHLPFDMIVFLQNKLLHELLFQEILWEEEHQQQKSGLYVKTLEAVGPKAFALKLFSNWKIAKIFNKLNIPQKIYQESTRTASAAGLLVGIAVRNEDSAFIHAGRLMENIWLRATKLDLSFQLMTGIVFLWQQLNYGKHDIFSQKEKDIINRAYENLGEVLNAKDKIIALTFRIGKSEKPLATSHKRPAQIDWD